MPKRRGLLVSDVAGHPLAREWAAEGAYASTYRPKSSDQPLLVYHGSKSARNRVGFLFVTTSKSGAASHGDITEYTVKPGARIYPDLEAQAYLPAGADRSGLGTLRSPNGSAAIIHVDDLDNPTPAMFTVAEMHAAEVATLAFHMGAAPESVAMLRARPDALAIVRRWATSPNASQTTRVAASTLVAAVET